MAASEAVEKGWKLWNGSLPEDCVAEQKEPWRCYFGHRLYNTLKCMQNITIKIILKLTNYFFSTPLCFPMAIR